MTGLKNKGRLFCFCYVLYSSKCALNTDSSSELLPLCCQRFVRVRGARRPGFLDFSSLAAGQSSPGRLASRLWTSPLTGLCLDLLLGTSGVSEKCADLESKVPFAPLPSTPCSCLSTENTCHRDCLKFYFKRFL